MKLKKYLWQYLIDRQEKVSVEDQECTGCGSCRYYDFEYSSQLEGKTEWVRSMYKNHLDYSKPIEPVASPKRKYYRNKMDYVATQGKIGMRRGGFANVFDVENSCIFDPNIGKDLKEFRKFRKYSDYDLFTHEGVIRYFVFRKHEYNGEDEHTLSVILNEIPEDFENDLVEFMKSSYLWKKFTNVCLVKQSSFADMSYGEIVRTLKGGELHQDLTVEEDEYSFVFGPQSFFQANTSMFQEVLEYMRSVLGEESFSRVFDLYGGVGSIGIALSKYGNELISVESNPENTEYFEANAKINKIFGAKSVLSTVENFIRENEFKKEDLLVIDPPRAGMMKKAVEKLVERDVLPRKIIYMSCNPATQVQDLVLLSEKYNIESVKVFDMFPYTSHVESVAILSLKEN